MVMRVSFMVFKLSRQATEQWSTTYSIEQTDERDANVEQNEKKKIFVRIALSGASACISRSNTVMISEKHTLTRLRTKRTE